MKIINGIESFLVALFTLAMVLILVNVLLYVLR